jgi:hypothetical protein
MSYRNPRAYSPGKLDDVSPLGGKKFSVPSSISNKNIKIINSTKPKQLEISKDMKKIWSVKYQKIVNVKKDSTPVPFIATREKPGNF